MADDTAQSGITIPEELKAKHPELIALILGSESMNTEERQYWINILPVMTEDQIENLHQILQNEKDQLAAIDDKYSKEMEKIGRGKAVQEMEKTRKDKRASRSKKEKAAEAEEKAREQEILQAIEGLEE